MVLHRLPSRPTIQLGDISGGVCIDGFACASRAIRDRDQELIVHLSFGHSGSKGGSLEDEQRVRVVAMPRIGSNTQIAEFAPRAKRSAFSERVCTPYGLRGENLIRNII